MAAAAAEITSELGRLGAHGCERLGFPDKPSSLYEYCLSMEFLIGRSLANRALEHIAERAAC